MKLVVLRATEPLGSLWTAPSPLPRKGHKETFLLTLRAAKALVHRSRVWVLLPALVAGDPVWVIITPPIPRKRVSMRQSTWRGGMIFPGDFAFPGQ